jgi:hypothetical protein
MSKLSLALPCMAMALATLGTPTASQAQIIPAPSTFTISGPLLFTSVGGPPITCNVSMTINSHPGGMTGSVSSAAVTPGNFVCPGLFPRGLPWPVARTSTGSISISNIRLETIMSTYCTGTLHVSWGSNPLGTGSADTGTMPGNFNGNPYPTGSCTLSGPMTVTSGGPVSVL